MKTTVNTIIVKNTALLLVGLMICMIVSQSVYTHSHILSNGQVISHAHPFDTSHDTEPFKSHHHTKSEIIFLENIKILFPLFFLLLIAFIFLKKARHFIDPSFNIYPAIILIETGRSPPD